MQQGSAVTTLFCYAREDKGLLDQLKTHLSPLQKLNVINMWDDGDISAGAEWEPEIKNHLNNAKIILLLISADFIASDYCYSMEMQHALKRHERGEARVVPVILRPVIDWEQVPSGDMQLGGLQAFPKEAKAVMLWENRDEAWKNVAEGISRVANELQMPLSLSSSETIQWLLRGHTAFLSGQYEEALKAYTQYIVLDPSHAGAYYDRGVTYAYLKQYKNAIQDYDQAIRLDSNDALYYHQKGLSLAALKSYERAIRSYTYAIARDPRLSSAYYERGRSHTSLKQYKQALQDFDQAIHLDPNCPLFYVHKGEVLNIAKDYIEALVCFDYAIRLDHSLPLSHIGRARALVALRRYEEAFISFEQAIRLDPPHLFSYVYKGDVLILLGRYKEALATFDRAICLLANSALDEEDTANPFIPLLRYSDAFSSISRDYLLSRSISSFILDTSYVLPGGFDITTRKIRDELLIFSEVQVRPHPSLAYAYLGKGYVLQCLGRFNEAIAAHHQAIRLDSSLAQSYYNIGPMIWDHQPNAQLSNEIDRDETVSIIALAKVQSQRTEVDHLKLFKAFQGKRSGQKKTKAPDMLQPNLQRRIEKDARKPRQIWLDAPIAAICIVLLLFAITINHGQMNHKQTVQTVGTLLYSYHTPDSGIYSTIVDSVAWSPNSKYLAVAAGDKTVHVLNPATMEEVLVYRGNQGWVNNAIWFPDGKHIASVSSDNTVQVWDALTGQDAFTFTDVSPIWTVAVSPDSDDIAWSGKDGIVQVWRISSKTHIYTYTGQTHSGGIWGLAFSPDGKRIASGDMMGVVQEWNALSGGNVLTYKGHTKQIYDLKWSPDGKYIASASADGTVRVWNASNGSTTYVHNLSSAPMQTVSVFSVTTTAMEAVSWSPDGSHIASASADGIVQVWNALDGSNSFVYTHHSGIVFAVAWSPDGSRIASGDESGSLQVWQAE